MNPALDAACEHFQRIIAEELGAKGPAVEQLVRGLVEDLVSSGELDPADAGAVRSVALESAERIQEDAGGASRNGPATWEPFPADALPSSLRDLAREGADAIGCDPAFIALPALVVCAGTIGLARDVRIRTGSSKSWREPSVLWGAIVGESGTAKSPALDLVEAPLLKRQADAMRAHKRAHAAWLKRSRKERAAAKKEKREPELEAEPICERYVAKDATIEILATLLARNLRGLTVIRDELAAWFRSWGEYKAKASGDAVKWLEMYGARALIVDRVGEGRSCYVERAAVSVVGGIQPETLRRVLTPEHLESGCGARVLFAYPPRRARKYPDADVSDATLDEYERALTALALLDPQSVRSEDGEYSLRPEGLPLSTEAHELYARYVDELGAEALEYDGAEAAAASKLEGAAARLALVIALVEGAERSRADKAVTSELEALKADATAREAFAHLLTTSPDDEEARSQAAATAEAARKAADEVRAAADKARRDWNRSVHEVDASAMRRGIRLARWFLREARRVLCLLCGEENEGEAPEDRDRRKLLEWIAQRGSKGATAREAARGLRRFRGSSIAAEEALDALVEAGVVERVPGPRTARYRLPGAVEAADTPAPDDTADADTFVPLDSTAARSVSVGSVGTPDASAPDRLESSDETRAEREAIQAVEAEAERAAGRTS